MRADLLVIGGGPAGLAAAIAAAQAGLSVELAEPRAGELDKCCGEGLLPMAVAALGQLGIPLRKLQEHGSLLEGICFRNERSRSAARFRAPAVGLRRTSLHALLSERAREIGVRVLRGGARLLDGGQGNRVRFFGGDRDGEAGCARWIAGADGGMSGVRAAAGLDAGRLASRRFAIRQHFLLPRECLAPASVEVHWGRGAQAYVTPVGEGCVGIAVLGCVKFTDMRSALAAFPALQGLLRDAVACSAPMGAVTVHRSLRAVCRGPVALVGDASGGVDAVTGDGLSLAFAQALALGAALRAGDLLGYARAHRQLMRVPRLMSRALLAMGTHPILTRPSLELLAHTPGLFPALLDLHTRGPRKENPPWLLAPTSAKSEM